MSNLVTCSRIGQNLTDWAIEASDQDREALCEAIDCGGKVEGGDTQTLAVSVDGDNVITGDVKISAEEDNALEVKPDGLYVPEPPCDALPPIPEITSIVVPDKEEAGGMVMTMHFDFEVLAEPPSPNPYARQFGELLIFAKHEDNGQVATHVEGNGVGAFLKLIDYTKVSDGGILGLEDDDGVGFAAIEIGRKVILDFLDMIQITPEDAHMPLEIAGLNVSATDDCGLAIPITAEVWDAYDPQSVLVGFIGQNAKVGARVRVSVDLNLVRRPG